ncbi:MAG: DNA-directed RNA polymerase subunit D [Candidatus Woesearchaeota archaeon]
MSVSLQKQDNEAIFSFNKTKNEIVNSIRRTIIDNVLTFAIEDVEIIKNETPLYDETLAHRLGLIPLKTNLKDYNVKSKCSCKGVGCALCEVTFTLQTQDNGYVYSKELKSDDPQIYPVGGEIPITKIFGNKGVHIKAKAILGEGREHAKWSPAHAYLKEGDSDSINLVLELHGQLSAEETFNSALEILISKVEEVEKQL